MINKEYLKKKYPELDAEDVEFLVSSATSIYQSITHNETVRPEHENWILRCCIELKEKEGYSGSTSYSENGVSATYDNSQISNALRGELPNYAIVYDKRGNIVSDE